MSIFQILITIIIWQRFYRVNYISRLANMEGMKSQMVSMLQGFERYNPDNIKTLECYVDLQARERGYDLEANLALLKLYQFNPTHTNMAVVVQVH